jgi:RNA polymerase sigma factor (sigma-70 family)
MQKVVYHTQVNTDAVIIEKILNGDLSLFEILIRRYNPVLYRLARGYGFNHQDAEDLMQDVHVIAFTQLSKFEGRASYKTWISRIMINKCIYKLKYGFFKNELPTDRILEINNQPTVVKARQNQTENVLSNRELTSILEKSIQNIPVIYQIVFILREVEGYSIAETAELLDITPTNVKVRLNRAKTLLQKEIENYYSRADIYSFNLVYCDVIVNKVFEKINAIKAAGDHSVSSEEYL